MKKNNYLVVVNNLDLIKNLKESNVTFLFPISNYAMGFETTFKITDITVDKAFIFINRVLDNESIKALREELKSLPKNIKGIVFDDIGVLNILLEEKLDLVKILFLNHLNCNYESINSWLEYVDSVVPSVDITDEETKEILDKTQKPLTLFTFGYVNIMYSRRTLLTNYNKNFGLNVPLTSDLEEKISHHKLRMVENAYGTVVYTGEPFNNLKVRGYENVLYNLINTVFLSTEEIINIIHSDDNLEEKYPYKYLSMEKTIFKLKEDTK